MKAKTDFLFCLTNKAVAENLDKVCSGAGFSFKIVGDFDRLLSSIESQHFSYIFVDLDDDELKPLQTLDWLGTYFLYSKIGVFTAKAYTNEFLQALRLGAVFFITQPQYENEGKLKAVLDELIHVTDHSLPLLISGEKGIGKEMVAKDLAQKAGFSQFVVFDADKMPEYEQKKKFLETVTGLTGKSGACFCLHHISSLHLEIQEMVVEYLVHKKLDVPGMEDFRARVLATTSKNLLPLVQQGKFREDLYHILQQTCYEMVPLRERRVHIPSLVEALLNEAPKVCFFSKDAMMALIDYHWPGNDAELTRVISAVLKSADSAVLSAKLLPQEILQKSYYKTDSGLEDIFDGDYNEAKKRVLHQFSYDYIAKLIKNSDENLTVAAERAGMDRSNFKKLMKKYGFE